MTDDFDLSDFDTPTETPDHRILLDVIRAEAGAGIQGMIAPIVGAQKDLQNTVAALSKEMRSIAAAKSDLKQARSDLTWDRILQLLTVSVALAGILAGAGIGWQAIKPPKVEIQSHFYGCTGRVTNGRCQGEWRLIQTQKARKATE